MKRIGLSSLPAVSHAFKWIRRQWPGVGCKAWTPATDVFPALVQLMLDGKYFKRIDGVKFVGTAEVLYNKKTLARDRGDILYQLWGIRPPILQISRKAANC